MPAYRVRVTITESWDVDVESDNEEEAQEEAEYIVVGTEFFSAPGVSFVSCDDRTYEVTKLKRSPRQCKPTV